MLAPRTWVCSAHAIHCQGAWLPQSRQHLLHKLCGAVPSPLRAVSSRLGETGFISVWCGASVRRNILPLANSYRACLHHHVACQGRPRVKTSMPRECCRSQFGPISGLSPMPDVRTNTGRGFVHTACDVKASIWCQPPSPQRVIREPFPPAPQMETLRPDGGESRG